MKLFSTVLLAAAVAAATATVTVPLKRVRSVTEQLREAGFHKVGWASRNYPSVVQGKSNVPVTNFEVRDVRQRAEAALEVWEWKAILGSKGAHQPCNGQVAQYTRAAGIIL